MQILSHEEAEERYGLTKEDLSEFQQESHVAIAKTPQMVEAAIDYNECEDDSERLQIAKSLIELNRMTMEPSLQNWFLIKCLLIISTKSH